VKNSIIVILLMGVISFLYSEDPAVEIILKKEQASESVSDSIKTNKSVLIKKPVAKSKRDNEHVTEKSKTMYKPGDHELLIMPTAYTMPKGQFYFTDYELVLLNLGYAVTDKTHLSLFSMFPIVSEFTYSITAGFKHRFYKKDKLAAAFTGLYNPRFGILSGGTVISAGNLEKSLHISVSVSGKGGDKDISFSYMLGGRIDTGKKTSLFAEYMNSDTDDEDFYGLGTAGIRFRGEYLSWDFGGIRPISDDTDDIILLPYLKATYIFGNRK